MGIIQLLNAGKKKFTTIDVALDEVAMFALALLIAKFWAPILSLDWYWYAIVFVVFVIKPVMVMLKDYL